MELEAVKPAHGGFAPTGDFSEHLVAVDAAVVAHHQRGRVDEGDPGVLAPHLEAAFTAVASGSGVRAHPATTFRVQVAEGPAADTNRVYGVLGALLRLGTERATTNDLLALATTDLVARRFGIDADAAERLEDLLDRAGVRWGINQAHRARFGLDQVVQSTWQLGVQRLILGEAFSADRPTSVGTVATVDDVSSTDTALVGAIAELVSRTITSVTTSGVACNEAEVPVW